MSGSSTVRPYARALYEIASSQGIEERIARDLALVRALWEDDPKATQSFLTHPLIRSAVKEEVLERALGAIIHPHTLNLLRLLLRRGEAPLIPGLAPAFFQEREDAGTACHVTLRTARPLAPDARDSLRSRLTEVLGKAVMVEEVESPQLLAGVELSVSGRRVEDSLRARLSALKVQLGGKR